MPSLVFPARSAILVALCCLLAAPALAQDDFIVNKPTGNVTRVSPATPGLTVVGPRASEVTLTAEECIGLGGTVTGSSSCHKLGQKACGTVDRHGVVRYQCIDEVAE